MTTASITAVRAGTRWGVCSEGLIVAMHHRRLSNVISIPDIASSRGHLDVTIGSFHRASAGTG